MKIAVFASNHGEKALHLHNFFKEGNRVVLDILYTDNPTAPIIEKMKEEGVEVVVLTPASSGEEMAENLRDRDIELLIIDDFKGDIPAEVKEAYGEAIIEPTSPQASPLEIITLADRLNAALRNQQTDNTPQQSHAADTEEQPSLESDVDQEWAEALQVETDTPEVPQKEEPAPVPPQYEQPHPPYIQRPEFDRRQPQNQTPPPYGYPGQPNPDSPAEPIPDTYLIWSVIITILCCLIPGIIAIIYSSSVSSKYYRGDIEGAKRASRNAQIWCIVSIVTGIIWATLYVPLSLLLP